VSTSKYGSKYRALENPYAKLSMMDDPDEEVSLEAQRAPTVVKIVGRAVAKAVFRSECKRLFTQYMPNAERGKLRQHYKDFISRNEDQLPERRGALLVALARYDLASSGYRSQFNRERVSLTEAKLLAIEKLIEHENGDSL
jgi:hypothetical protein